MLPVQKCDHPNLLKECVLDSLHNEKTHKSQKYLVIYGTNPLKTQQHEGYSQPELVKCILIQITLFFRQQNHMAMKQSYDMINESENLHMHPLHSKQQHDSVLPRPSLRAAAF